MRRRQPSTESTARTSAGTTLGSAGTGDPDLTERGPGGCVCPEPPPSPQVGPDGRPGPRMGERGSPRQGGCAPHPERWLRTGYEASLRGVQRGSRAPLTRPLALPGADSAVKEEVQRLQSRVDVLEQVRPELGTQGLARSLPLAPGAAQTRGGGGVQWGHPGRLPGY